ncbi:hypothetical protein B7435_16930 [Mycolicibacterium peregrinum]|uniref:ESX-1 secretion-associated protein n=1 Tax=Mycolicibacterium peregrinum TaxID=43304 RepID=UPI000B4B6660|nr:ESX-1 secretion-associated protein [Mycolicibacterium peregrinum]OWM01245.1 hypothetical protein B7435_16930 [Mycolicibacterium peregrinum]
MSDQLRVDPAELITAAASHRQRGQQWQTVARTPPNDPDALSAAWGPIAHATTQQLRVFNEQRAANAEAIAGEHDNLADKLTDAAHRYTATDERGASEVTDSSDRDRGEGGDRRDPSIQALDTPSHDKPYTGPDKITLGDPAPTSELPGAGYWVVDKTQAYPTDQVPPGLTPGPKTPTTMPDQIRTGPYTGQMSMGQPDAATTGFDYEHNYHFRIAGIEPTDTTKMVQIGDSWYPATWNRYAYEVQDLNRIVGIGDLGAISEIPSASAWTPISHSEIRQLSHQFPTNTFYLPDGCGSNLQLVDTNIRNTPFQGPVVPIIRMGR